jgi:hypothetical protein
MPRWIVLLGLAALATAGYFAYQAFAGYDREAAARAEFVRRVRAAFRNSPEDLRLLTAAGYPDSFISKKIRADNLRTREQVSRLFVGFQGRKTTRRPDGGIVDEWRLVVGRMIDQVVDVSYGADGRFEAIGNPGPSLGRGTE